MIEAGLVQFAAGILIGILLVLLLAIGVLLRNIYRDYQSIRDSIDEMEEACDR